MVRFAPQTIAVLLVSCAAHAPATTAPSRANGRAAITAAKRDATTPVTLAFDRRLPVGLVLQHDVRTDTRDATVTKLGGNIVDERSEFQRLHFVADGKVIDVDASGRASTLEYVVHDFAELGPTTTRRLVEAQSKIRLSFHDGTWSVDVDGVPAVDPVRRAVLAFIDGVRAPFVEQAVFGTPAPQRPGQSWPINAPSLAHTLNQSQRLAVEDSSVAGRVTFTALERNAGVDCARIRTEFRVPVRSVDDLPKAATLEQAEVVGRASALVPVDRAAPPVGSTVTLASAARVRIATEKGPATMESLRVRFEDVLFRPTPAALVGQAAPELDATLLYSEQRPKIGDYAGKFLVLVFWSPRCPECRDALSAVMQRNGRSDAVLGIVVPSSSTKVDTSEVRRVVHAWRVDMPVAIGTQGLANRYRALALPATVVIDPSGHIAAARVGALSGTELERVSGDSTRSLRPSEHRAVSEE